MCLPSSILWCAFTTSSNLKTESTKHLIFLSINRGKTNFFEFTELVGILIKKLCVKLLVSHSFGGVATTYALFQNQDIEIKKYILITTPDKFTQRIDDVSEIIGSVFTT